jgi:hypothetical protein
MADFKYKAIHYSIFINRHFFGFHLKICLLLQSGLLRGAVFYFQACRWRPKSKTPSPAHPSACERKEYCLAFINKKWKMQQINNCRGSAYGAKHQGSIFLQTGSAYGTAENL